MRQILNRREVLRLLGGLVAVPMLGPLSAEDVLGLGRGVHARLASNTARSLDPHQLQTVTRIADMILPETDTPGAATVKVPEFIDLMLTEWYPPPERYRVLTGLTEIDNQSRRLYGGVFLDLRAAEQTAVLTALDGVKGVEGSAEDAFATLKELTIVGYFTSEVVMKEVLRDPIIPGRFDGCVPV